MSLPILSPFSLVFSVFCTARSDATRWHLSRIDNVDVWRQTPLQGEECQSSSVEMAGHLKSGPDPSKPLSSATAIFRGQPEDLSFENDFSDLAARFSAQNGGGLTPELSADLALEIVLNEIVEQACRITGATGAAIVLEREGEMVCRASAGNTAPQLGTAVDTQAGLAGECLKTRRIQWCDDALSDHRADAEASMRVGVRSVVVMPLVSANESIGLLELFSTQPFAFGVRDERVLEVLADRTLSNLRRALNVPEPDPPAPEPPVAPPPAIAQATVIEQQFFEPSEPVQPEEPAPVSMDHSARPTPWYSDAVVWSLGIAIVAASVLLGVVLGRRMGPSDAQADRVVPAVQAAEPAPARSTPLTPVSQSKITSVAQQQPSSALKISPARPAHQEAVPPGGLLVLQNGKEVFRMAPTQNPQVPADNHDGVQFASELRPDGVIEVPEAAAVRELVDRVEPQYPEEARAQSIQGPVVLEVHIGTAGTVQDVRVISGAPLLAQASIDAVKQWRFKPRAPNGRPVEMQTRITLNFRLDQ